MIGFQVNSTSTITRRVARLNRILQRAKVAEVIDHAGVFNCRKTAGTDLWSAHAFGDATDLFPIEQAPELIDRIADAVIRHATRPTRANRGVPVLGIRYVIFGTRAWIRGRGVLPYHGTPHTSHVHAAGSFSTTTTPPCARG